MNLITSHLPLRLAAIVLVALLGISCASVPASNPQAGVSKSRPLPLPLPLPLSLSSSPPQDSEIIQLSILATPTAKKVIPAGTRIVVANITNSSEQRDPCSDAVKDALMRRLIENASYDVLSRDDLDWIMNEMNMNWSGIFDTQKVKEMGKLLGASVFVVGRVTYCGPTANTAPDSESEIQFSIFATLQIIDLESGKVMVSSASEGNFVPTPGALARLLNLPPFQELEEEEPQPKPDLPSQEQEAQASQLKLNPSLVSSVLSVAKNLPVESGAKYSQVLPAINAVDNLVDGLGGASDPIGSPLLPEQALPGGDDKNEKAKQYQLFRAAEDLANGFADSFFARSVWQNVEMWHNPGWAHSDVIHYVKLGDCSRALTLFHRTAKEIARMGPREMAGYLHNYGVVLMCANDFDRAVDKLRSAYRLGYNKTTLRMLGIAQKMQEWSLWTEEDVQPEVDLLTEQITLWRQNLR